MPIRIAAGKACFICTPLINRRAVSASVSISRLPLPVLPPRTRPQACQPLPPPYRKMSTTTGSGTPAAPSSRPASGPSTPPLPDISPSPSPPLASNGQPPEASAAEPAPPSASTPSPTAKAVNGEIPLPEQDPLPIPTVLPGLPAPGTGTPPSSSNGLRTIEVNGQAVALDNLGPMVVGRDGTLARVSNWHEMTEHEQKMTLRVLGKRNQLRLGNLKAGRGADAKE